MAINEKRLKRIGIVADIEVLGILPSGVKPPGLLLRYPRTGEAMAFTLKEAHALTWHVKLWLDEVGHGG